MKIYHSTEYIKPEDDKVGNLKLEVVSQWDFTTKRVCYETLSRGDVIGFALKKCTKVISKTTTEWGYVEKLTKDMKKELIRLGYELASAQSEDK